MQRFRGGLVFKAHRLCVALNSGLESNKEEKEVHLKLAAREVVEPRLPPVLWPASGFGVQGLGFRVEG